MELRRHPILKTQEEDLRALQQFLTVNKLRSTIVLNQSSLYYHVKFENNIIGSIGAEVDRPYALIRAAGVAPEWRRMGIAKDLFEKLTAALIHTGVSHLYLFSRQAPEFWMKMGFEKCTIQEVIDVLSATPQVKEFIEDKSIWTDVPWHKSISGKT